MNGDGSVVSQFNFEGNVFFYYFFNMLTFFFLAMSFNVSLKLILYLIIDGRLRFRYIWLYILFTYIVITKFFTHFITLSGCITCDHNNLPQLPFTTTQRTGYLTISISYLITNNCDHSLPRKVVPTAHVGHAPSPCSFLDPIFVNFESLCLPKFSLALNEI